jgi:hypothetical protein
VYVRKLTSRIDMDDAMLRADCGRCSAFCCVALAFDRSEQFAYDKACDEACRHLTRSFECRIHTALSQKGFGGCASYDCFGAGQRVHDFYGGRSWRDNPDDAKEMFEMFRLLRKVHELIAVLRAARKLPLSELELVHRQRFEDSLLPVEGWTIETLRVFEDDAVRHEIGEFLASLKQRVRR